MTTIKSYTDLSQSKTLSKILPLESADMCYDWFVIGKEYSNIPQCRKFIDDELPCWSLAALLDVLPKQFGRYTKSLGWFDDAWHCAYMDEDSECKYCVSADNSVDACCEMILKLHEQKLL